MTTPIDVVATAAAAAIYRLLPMPIVAGNKTFATTKETIVFCVRTSENTKNKKKKTKKICVQNSHLVEVCFIVMCGCMDGMSKKGEYKPPTTRINIIHRRVVSKSLAALYNMN